MRAKYTNGSTAYCFDFDNTIAIDTAVTHLYRNGVYVRPITAEEFNTYVNQPGDYLDFSEFDHPKDINAQKGPAWNTLKTLVDSNKPVFIVTARRDTIQSSIHRFLLKNGVNIIIDRIHCVGDHVGTIPVAKWRVIENSIVPLYNDVVMYDDNYETIKFLSKKGVKAIHVQ